MHNIRFILNTEKFFLNFGNTDNLNISRRFFFSKIIFEKFFYLNESLQSKKKIINFPCMQYIYTSYVYAISMYRNLKISTLSLHIYMKHMISRHLKHMHAFVHVYNINIWMSQNQVHFTFYLPFKFVCLSQTVGKIFSCCLTRKLSKNFKNNWNLHFSFVKILNK